MIALRKPLRRETLVWFGVLGSPGAWTLQHVAGFALAEANCEEAGRTAWDVGMQGWTIAVTAAAAAIAVASGLAAIATFRATRDSGSEPPLSRVHFLSVIGITIWPLFLAMILMTGTGAVVLDNCRQS